MITTGEIGLRFWREECLWRCRYRAEKGQIHLAQAEWCNAVRMNRLLHALRPSLGCRVRPAGPLKGA